MFILERKNTHTHNGEYSIYQNVCQYCAIYGCHFHSTRDTLYKWLWYAKRASASARVCLNVTFANAIFRFMKNIAAVFLIKWTLVDVGSMRCIDDEILLRHFHIYNICFAKQKWRDTFTTESISPLIWCAAVNVYLYKKFSLNLRLPVPFLPSLFLCTVIFPKRNMLRLGLYIYV